MNKNGFTLVEVMIVVAIIALLAMFGIPGVMRARIQANESNAQATLKQISNALETFAVANGTYPASTTDLTSPIPPYLSRDYFANQYQGYSYSSVLDSYVYTVVASPVSTTLGRTTYTITTGAVLSASN